MEESSRTHALQFVQNALAFGDSVVLPVKVDRYLMSFADEEFGQNWVENDAVVDVLSTGLESLRKAYATMCAPDYDMGSLMAHLFGYAPLHFHKVPFLLRNLLRKSMLPDELRILDLGSGTGSASLSVIYFYELLANAVRIVTGKPGAFALTFTPLDRLEEAVRLYEKLVHNYRPSFPELRVQVRGQIQAELGPEPESLANTLGGDRFDLILASHFLGEMRDKSLSARARMLCNLAQFLKPSGAILFVESAPSTIASEMNQIKSRAVGGGLGLFHPCSTAWDKPTGRQCYTCSNASFERVRKPILADMLESICDGYEFSALVERNAWTYGVLRSDDLLHHPQLEIGSGLFTKLADLPDSKQSRASVYASVARREVDRVSEQPYFKICDQSCGSETAYLRFEPELGVPELESGDLLEIENARIEPAKGGRNRVFVVVDGESSIRNLSIDFRRVPSKLVLSPEVLG